MANEVKDVLRVTDTEANVVASIRQKQIGIATDTGRLVAHLPGGTKKYYQSSTELATTYLKLDQTTPQDIINGAPRFDAIDFDTTPSSSEAIARLTWDDNYGTLNLGMKGGQVNQAIGLELYRLVVNKTGADIANGKVVYVSGSQGNRPTIVLAKGDAEATSHACGVTTEDIDNNAEGYITTHGEVHGIKTDYTGSGIWGTTWNEGDELWVSKASAGTLTNVEPSAPHHSDKIAIVTNVHATQGSIELQISKHKTLEELSDVNGTALNTTGQIPVWNNTTGYFDFNYNLGDYLRRDGTTTLTAPWYMGDQTVMLGTVGTVTAQFDIYHTTGTSGHNACLRGENISAFTSGNAVSGWGLVGKAMPHTTSGTLTGEWAGVIGEGLLNNAASAGTYNGIYGLYSLVGINSADAGAHVANAYGLFVYCQKGAATIDEYYGIYLNPPVGGGTLTRGRSIYDNSGLAAWFKYRLGIGTGAEEPLYPLDVNGYSYLRSAVGVGVVPSDTNKLYVSATSTNQSYTTMRNEMVAADTTAAERYYYACTNDASRSVSNGITATGSLIALYNLAYRNGATTANAGTLGTIIGSENLIGHGPSCNASATTTNVYGLSVTPWTYAGTIGNFYMLLLNSPGGAGATITGDKHSVFDNSGWPAYFKYRIGINTTAPDCALHVIGDAFFPDDKIIYMGGSFASPDVIIEHDTASTPDRLLIENQTSGEDVYLKATSGNIVADGSAVVVNKTSGTGIKVDVTAPTFAWRDLLGAINVRDAAGGGAAAMPDYVAYRGSLYAYRFGTVAPNNHLHEAFIEYHVPHDWVPGTAGAGYKAYIHVHWSQTTVDTGGTAGVPGVAKWYFDISYADGHGTAGGAADPFIAPVTFSVTQQGSTTQYGHMIAEVEFANDGGTGGALDYNTIQVDGLFLVRIYRDPADGADTLNQDTFVHFVDIHYQSTGIGTKNKAPNFYS